MQFYFYKENNEWKMDVINEERNTILSFPFENISTTEIITTAITLGKANGVKVLTDFTNKVGDK